jgi:hypothetical protein
MFFAIAGFAFIVIFAFLYFVVDIFNVKNYY